MLLNKKNINDIILWIVIFVLIILAFICFYHFSNYLLITRIFFLVMIFLIALSLFSYTNFGKFCWNYIKESFKEIHLITWTTKKETLQTTLIISIIVFSMGLILCLIDIMFFNLIKWVANFG